MKKMGRLYALVLVIFVLLSPINSYSAGNNEREQAYLIEKYLIEHKENISVYANKYGFFSDTNLQMNLEQIDVIIGQLKSIQNNSNPNSNVKISKYLGDIKTINEDMERLLNKKKNEYDERLREKQNTYEQLGKKLSSKLDEMYYTLDNNYKYNNSHLSDKEKRVKNSLDALKILSMELNYFGLKEFDTLRDLDVSFNGAIENIKYHITNIRNNIE